MNWIHHITGLLQYDPQSPILFTGLFFWGFLLFTLLGYSLVYTRPPLRNAWLFAVSLYFYYKCSGVFIFLLLASIVINYYLGVGIQKSRRQLIRKLYVFLAVLSCILLLSYFKYAYFFINGWNNLFGTHIQVINYFAVWGDKFFNAHFNIGIIFLPAGISFYSFQALSYIIDLYRKKTLPVKNLIDFGFYKSFFPQLIAGPIVRASEFVPQIYSKYLLSNREASHAMFLILNGLIKKMLLSDYLSLNYVDRIFDNPHAYTGFENLMGVYGYALQIYCDFSGYTDIAIGVALLLGFRIPVNFNAPYKAVSLIDFWKRWHISLSLWLKDYLYISVGGNRKGKFRTNLNLLFTMLIGGLWHGANIRFLLWGSMHGLGLIINKQWEKFTGKPQELNGTKKFINQAITFHFVCLAWILFRSQNLNTAYIILSQIFNHFGFLQIPMMVSGYIPIFSLIFLGFTIHWLPWQIKEKYRGWFIYTPLYLKIIIAVGVILFLFQIKSAVIQPFIYFQF